MESIEEYRKIRTDVEEQFCVDRSTAFEIILVLRSTAALASGDTLSEQEKLGFIKQALSISPA